jgi:guanyl-specific ribonuclease Sa
MARLTLARLCVLLGILLMPGQPGAIAGFTASETTSTVGATVPGDAATSLPEATDTRGLADQAPGEIFKKQPPQKAKEILEAIRKRNGEPLPGYVGGRVFQNRERRLPSGFYREYDVNPKRPGRNRGAERLVIEQRTGKAYYTDDHYRTFTPMN